MQELLNRAVIARLDVAENPEASINIKDEASKDGLEGVLTLQRNERREEEASATIEKEEKKKAKLAGYMEQQGREPLAGIPRLHASQMKQLDNFPPD